MRAIWNVHTSRSFPSPDLNPLWQIQLNCECTWLCCSFNFHAHFSCDRMYQHAWFVWRVHAQLSSHVLFAHRGKVANFCGQSKWERDCTQWRLSCFRRSFSSCKRWGCWECKQFMYRLRRYNGFFGVLTWATFPTPSLRLARNSRNVKFY